MFVTIFNCSWHQNTGIYLIQKNIIVNLLVFNVEAEVRLTADAGKGDVDALRGVGERIGRRLHSYWFVHGDGRRLACPSWNTRMVCRINIRMGEKMIYMQ